MVFEATGVDLVIRGETVEEEEKGAKDGSWGAPALRGGRERMFRAGETAKRLVSQKLITSERPRGVGAMASRTGRGGKTTFAGTPQTPCTK